MSRQFKKVPRSILALKVLEEMGRRAHTLRQAAETAGTSSAYLGYFLRGQIMDPSSNKDGLRALARYLGISTMQAYFWAGILSGADVLPQIEADKPEPLEPLYDDISRSESYGYLLPQPTDWADTPASTRALIAAMHQALTGRKFVEPVDVGEI